MIKVFEIILCMYLKTISPDVPRWACPVICYEQSIGSDLVYIDLRRLRKSAWKKLYNVYLLIKYSLELKRISTTGNSLNII
jgi:hypothetical protein